MKIVIAGGSGQLGSLLRQHFGPECHRIVNLTRSSKAANQPHVTNVRWDAKTIGPWTEQLESADVVINLAGRSVDCRYNKANRQLILDSRVDSTRAIGSAIRQCTSPPGLWLQSATATIYAHSFDQPNDENGIIGGEEPNVPDTWRFSIEVARRWEDAAAEFVTDSTRQVVMRTAMVMSPTTGGVFDVLSGLVNKRLGGTNGSGRQFVSWIHHVDFLRAVDWLIEHEEVEGIVNLAAPGPVANSEFMKNLRAAFGVRIGIPSPSWLLEVAAFFMRTETELLLKSRRVIPGRLLESGFQFEFPEWKAAASDLVQSLRQSHASCE